MVWSAFFCDTADTRPDVEAECIKLSLDDKIDSCRVMPNCPVLYEKHKKIDCDAIFAEDTIKTASVVCVMNYKVTIDAEIVRLIIGAFRQRELPVYRSLVCCQKDLREKFAKEGFNSYDDNNIPELIQWDDRGAFRSP